MSSLALMTSTQSIALTKKLPALERCTTSRRSYAFETQFPGDALVLWRAEVETAATPGHLVSEASELDLPSFEVKVLQAVGRGSYVVAEVAGAVCAHAFLDPMPLAAIRHVYRLTIVVHPGHTNQGIGTRLIQHLQAWARRQPQLRKIELLVRAGNIGAIRLYRRMGFVEEGRLRERVRLDEHTFVDDVALAWFPN